MTENGLDHRVDAGENAKGSLGGLERLFALTGNLIRDLYCGSNAVEEYVAIVRTIWDESGSKS